ncbi:MAG TPA: GAF and ANTAR domain-containing protein [Propionibacteriaceae bacterium]|nr:GAF and ANTAR domain-containing protein [Propionibacteriaceae bacterium]
MTITLTSPEVAGRAGLADFGAIAHDMFSEAMLGDTLDRVLAIGEQSFGGDAAGFLLVTGDQHVQALAASHRDAAIADQLQVETRQGPGQQAIARQQPVIATDLRSDSRWRFWAPLAADLGFRSVLSLSLQDGDTSGALTLYSRRTSNFTSADLPVAQVFAQHAAIAVAIATEREQLMRAVRTRGVVAQAQGILMERHHIPADHALTVLRRYATHLGQELFVFAQRFIEDRTLPPLDPTTALSS